MRDREDQRDLATLVLPKVGRLAETGGAWEPYRLLDADGTAIIPVAEYFAELQAADSSNATVSSYGMDLLRGGSCTRWGVVESGDMRGDSGLHAVDAVG